MDNFSRCTGSDSANSANEITERKTPDAGTLPVPKHDWPSATSSAMLAVISSRLGSQAGKGAHTGRFSLQPSGRVSKWAEVGRTQNRSSNVRALTQPLARDKQTCPGNTGNAQKFCHVKTSTRRYPVPPATDNETAGAADRPSDSHHKARRLIKE